MSQFYVNIGDHVIFSKTISESDVYQFACQIAFKADPLFAFNYDPPEGAGSVVPVWSIG